MSNSNEYQKNNRKKGSDTEKTCEFTDAESKAIEYIKNMMPSASYFHPWKSINNAIGGILVLVSFKVIEDEKTTDKDWCVLIRGDYRQIFYTMEDAMQNMAHYRPLTIELWTRPSTVIALISLGLIISAVIIYCNKGTVDEPFRTAIGSVVGFWLGKAIPDDRNRV